MEYLNVEPDLESTVYPPNARRKIAPPGTRPARAKVELREETTSEVTPKLAPV